MATNNMPNPAWDAKEGERRGANGIRIGRIVEARYDANKEGEPPENNDNPYFHNKDVNGHFRGPMYRVQIGDHKPYWMPQLHLRAGGDQEYWAFEVGEQVVVLCDAGDPMQSFILNALPCDAHRPPVGHDDLSHDKRPWRETVHRIRYGDGTLVEYDRYLHRRLTVFQDGSQYTDWLLDDREDRSPRKKETNSDKQNVPPRHWRNRNFPDGTDHEFLWDEDIKIHRKHWKFPDVSIFEYQWDEENQVHLEHALYADGTDYYHEWDEKAQTHTQNWTWPDGRTWEYQWNEANADHHQTLTHADGTMQRYHWNEEKQSIHETVYADGTQVIFQFPGPHHLQINFSDGSHIQYDLIANHLDMKMVGTVTAEIDGNTSVTCHANVTGKVDGTASVTIDGDTSLTCNSNLTATVAQKLTATAGSDVEVSSGTNIVLTAPYITLNGTGSGKNVKFNGNFGFAGNVEIDGTLETTEAISTKKTVNSDKEMYAKKFIIKP